MPNSSNEKRAMPSAPLAPPNYGNSVEFAQRAPPPSYEESQKIFGAQAPAALQNYRPQHYTEMYGTQALYDMQSPSAMGYAYPQQSVPPPPPYQPHIQQQQYYYYQSNMPAGNGQPHILTFARGAEIRTSVGNGVSVPPPPPGCTPTAVQLAAMQGQPVVLRKQNNTFF